MSERDERHVEALAEVLAEHEGYGGGWYCECTPADEDDARDPLPASFDHHLAQALLDSPAMRDLLAEAWDEGHAAGREYQADGWNSAAHDPAEDNPYRQEAR